MLAEERSRPIGTPDYRHAGSLLTAALLLASCGALPPDAPRDPAGMDSFDPETGARRTVIYRDNGPVTLVSGTQVPVTLPPGFTLPEGARVTGNTIASRPGGQGVLLSFETHADSVAVMQHYRAEAEADGFVVIAVLDTKAGQTLAAARADDGAILSLDIGEGKPTRVQLSIVTGSGTGTAR